MLTENTALHTLWLFQVNWTNEKLRWLKIELAIVHHEGGMGKADFIEWIKADFRECEFRADSTHAASQQNLFIVSGSPFNPILGEVT